MKNSIVFTQENYSDPITIAEIGVRDGEHALEMLKFLNIKKLYLIDPYLPYKDGNDFKDQNEQNQHLQKLKENIKPFSDRVELIIKNSEDAVNMFEDCSLDKVYIDACHDYKEVKKDNEIWWKKVKYGGCLCGHDYSEDWPGVMLAVKVFSENNNLKIDEICRNSDWIIKKNKKKNKNLVLTISCGVDYEKIASLTHSSIRDYAKKIGADFKYIDKKEIAETTPHWEKFQIYNFLNEYERVLYIDTDLIIRKDCPDLFELVPIDKLGMFEEGQFTDRCKELMIDICREYNVILPEWNGKYYNSGVIVASQKHKELFKKPEKEIFNFYEQSYINMMITKLNIDMYELHYKFNRMSCVDRFTGEDRHNSYIIHYAGFLFNTNINNLLRIIALDLEKWKKDFNNYCYDRHIYINVSGGLGDQICAEPAIRYMRKNLYPKDEFIVATHFPRVFEHLKKEGIEIFEHGKVCLKFDTPYFMAETLPGPNTVQWMIVSHLLCHTVDYVAMALMKRTIPLEKKTLKFIVNDNDYNNLYKLIDKDNVKNLIIIHPGKHWETKTFPKEYWQKIINGLVELDQKICLIGKDELGDSPDYKAGARGTVDVDCPEGHYDLRNKLNLGELGALLSGAKCLISNDSAPIHLAGAFDNWIVLLPSCKHPDHILPWRCGCQFYKTKILYNKLIIDEVESCPTQVYSTSVDVKINNWADYLVKPEKVVEEVNNIWQQVQD